MTQLRMSSQAVWPVVTVVKLLKLPCFVRAFIELMLWNNPRPWEQWLNGVRDRAIRMLQRRRRRRWLGADSQALRA